jgi:phosphoadenosine phosphosulfate reductase
MSKYNVNLLDVLKPFVEIPFADKLAATKAIIETTVAALPRKTVVAWSGGKDSTLVLYLVRQLEPDVDVVFNNTGVEYPETVRFVHEMTAAWNVNLIETKPKKGFWQCADEYGFPDKSKGGVHGKTPHCCYFLKEKPMEDAMRGHDWTAVFDGVTAVESRIRMFTARNKGTSYFNAHWKKFRVRPILYWTEEEVFEYFKTEGIPNNPRYAMGSRRVGCMACSAYKTWEANMSRENPKLYRIIKLRKDGHFQPEMKINKASVPE